jgi:hypothetical protein
MLTGGPHAGSGPDAWAATTPAEYNHRAQPRQAPTISGAGPTDVYGTTGSLTVPQPPAHAPPRPASRQRTYGRTDTYRPTH